MPPPTYQSTEKGLVGGQGAPAEPPGVALVGASRCRLRLVCSRHETGCHDATKRRRRLMTIRRLSLMVVLVAALAGFFSGSAQATANTPDPATSLLLNGRQLTPQGAQSHLRPSVSYTHQTLP